MSSLPNAPQALAGLRVLEVAGPMTQYCGKMFAELGADVVLIEPPGGSSLRTVPPFIGDQPGTERSLAYAYFNTSKRGITLDLSKPKGGELFRTLAKDADLVIESEKPGVMSKWGCGYPELSARKPSLVMASFTGFGQTGPYADWEWEDLIALATGGFLYLGGYEDLPPTGAYGDQAYLGAGMYGAVAAMLAVTGAELNGEGEHVDVSMQECMVMAMETAVQFYDLQGEIRQRHAGEQRFAGTGVFPCKDGYVYMMASGIGANKFWALSLQWMVDEKVPGVERLQGPEWNTMDYVKTEEAKKIFSEVFGPWAMTKPKAYIYGEGQRRHLPLAAINDPSDLLTSKQLEFRKYFIELMHPQTGTKLHMPGAPYQLHGTPWQLRSPAPSLGQHTAEVLGEIGVGAGELAALQKEGVI